MLGQCFAPSKKAISPRVSEEVRITFYEFDGALFADHFKDPEPANIRAPVFVSQTTRHWNLVPMGLQEGQVGWLGRAAYGKHLRAVFKDDYKAHS
jgi:hypothetical protein